MRRAFQKVGHFFEAIGGAVEVRGKRSDPFWRFRTEVNWAAVVFGAVFGVAVLIRFPGSPKLNVVAGFGLVCLGVAIYAMRARARRDSIRRTLFAVLMVAVTIGVMVLIGSVWPPLFF